MTPQKYETLLGVKKQENKLTEVEEIETTALATIEANSTATSLEVNNSMWLYVSECSLSDDGEEIFFYRNQVSKTINTCTMPDGMETKTNMYMFLTRNSDP